MGLDNGVWLWVLLWQQENLQDFSSFSFPTSSSPIPAFFSSWVKRNEFEILEEIIVRACQEKGYDRGSREKGKVEEVIGIVNGSEKKGRWEAGNEILYTWLLVLIPQLLLSA